MRKTDEKIALERLRKLCSSREKCRFDLIRKLKQWDVDERSNDKILQTLEQEGFFNHERYTRAFINDKHQFQHWGKIKLRYELRKKDVEETIIEKALNGMDETAYEETLKQLIRKKHGELSQRTSGFELKQKLIQFATHRGYEYELIFNILDDSVEFDFGD